MGYMYENAVAQIIQSNNRELYYHTWRKKNSTHYYEIDFLITAKNKVVPIEVESSAVRNHESIEQFAIKYSSCVGERYLVSQKDVSSKWNVKIKTNLYGTIFT